MKHPPVQASQPQIIQSVSLLDTKPAFQWEQLPPERQHELTMTLTAILVKQILSQTEGQNEVAHE